MVMRTEAVLTMVVTHPGESSGSVGMSPNTYHVTRYVLELHEGELRAHVHVHRAANIMAAPVERAAPVRRSWTRIARGT